jgi:hypothetical protein
MKIPPFVQQSPFVIKTADFRSTGSLSKHYQMFSDISVPGNEKNNQAPIANQH